MLSLPHPLGRFHRRARWIEGDSPTRAWAILRPELGSERREHRTASMARRAREVKMAPPQQGRIPAERAGTPAAPACSNKECRRCSVAASVGRAHVARPGWPPSLASCARSPWVRDTPGRIRIRRTDWGSRAHSTTPLPGTLGQPERQPRQSRRTIKRVGGIGGA